MINGINVYSCEDRGEKLASRSLERTRLEEIITEVSKTPLSIEKGKSGNGSKANEDVSRKEQRTVY